MPPRFGLSTRIVHDARLEPRHLALAARHGFTTLELSATRTHIDYANPAVLQALASGLAGEGLAVSAVRAPRADGLRNGAWVVPFSLASDDAAERRHALDEATLALAIAPVIPYEVLIVHLERPRGSGDAATESLGAARKSLTVLAEAAEPLGVRLALASGGGPLSRPDALVRLIERDLDEHHAGICLDFGHAHIHGGVADAIEEAGEHMVAALLHDNHGRRDEHLVPFSGSLPWDPAMMSTQKIGYDGVLTLDVDGGADTAATLERVARACERLRDMLVTF